MTTIDCAECRRTRIQRSNIPAIAAGEKLEEDDGDDLDIALHPNRKYIFDLELLRAVSEVSGSNAVYGRAGQQQIDFCIR